MKFGIGDVVQVCGIKDEYAERFNDYIGTVVRFTYGELHPFLVELNEGVNKVERAFKESELTLFLPKKLEVRDSDVHHPSHYTSHPSGVEAKTIVGHYPFFVGSAMKYLWRAGLKTEDATTDLRKAIQNIEFEIERIETKGN